MSQEDILDIVRELGGEATSKIISKRAKEKFPNRTLYTYVRTRLNQLEKNGFIEKKNEIWKIKKV